MITKEALDELTKEPALSVDDRIQVTKVPLALPGNCAICGFAGGPENDGRSFIDWGLSLEFHGAVIFCSKCFEAAANTIGYVAPEFANRLREAVRELEVSLAKKDGEIVKLSSALDALRGVGLVYYPDSAVGDNQAGSENKDPGKQGEEPNVGSSKSSDGGGSADIRKTDNPKQDSVGSAKSAKPAEPANAGDEFPDEYEDDTVL